MKPREAIVAALALVLALACARMALWQGGRWREKTRANAALAAALAAPAESLAAPGAFAPGASPRRVRIAGAFDAHVALLVSDRWRDDRAGVELMTPLVLADGGAVLVDRGWLPSADGIVASPPAPPRGALVVEGLAEPFASAAPRAGTRGGPAAWTRLAGDSVACWSARAAARESLAARVPYALAPWVLRALPAGRDTSPPVAEPPVPADAGMHLSYALQWCLFALAFLAGGAFVIARGRASPRVARAPR